MGTKLWRPFPPGIIMLYFFAPMTTVFLIIAALQGNVFLGIVALVFGAFCIYLTAEAAYHVGMRRATTAERIRAWGRTHASSNNNSEHTEES